jgi:predicted aspartyl protease
VTRYRYNHQVNPAAPFVHVSLQALEGTAEVVELPAQLDTAADITVVPEILVLHARLVLFGTMEVAAFGGIVTTVRTFLARVQIRGEKAVVIKVVSSAHEPHILLGRDILNSHRIVLDGPGGFLEIE